MAEPPNSFTQISTLRGYRLTAINGALALIAILLIVQMWLLTATLEEFLADHRETALPAAIISGVLLLACVALYLFVNRVDDEVRHYERT
jgi:hypothetical protein